MMDVELRSKGKQRLDGLAIPKISLRRLLLSGIIHSGRKKAIEEIAQICLLGCAVSGLEGALGIIEKSRVCFHPLKTPR